MVTRANTRDPGIGGHLSTYASSASLYEVGFNHFFRGKDNGTAGDQVYFQGHASPGIYARAYVEGRLGDEELDNFRFEVGGNGLVQLPAPPPHARLVGVPDGLDGPRPAHGHLPGALQSLPLNRELADTTQSRVWCFVGDGEFDEPETRAALSLAARERLDNLTFVVNCNLQRLDGPVRGNGKIIQELEALLRGCGWNVIKVIWGRRWDELLARDVDGVLAQQDEHDSRRRLPDARHRVGRLHPRALLRPGPPLAQARGAPLRRGAADLAPGRARLPQALRRLQGGDRAGRGADGNPREDHQGLDARARDRSAQRHPPDQEDDQGSAPGAARPTAPARGDPRRCARRRRSRPTTAHRWDRPCTST